MRDNEPDNPMTLHAQDELDHRAANADRAGRAHQLMVDEFLDALLTGPQTPISYCYAQATLAQVIDELTEDADIALYLANEYASREVARYAERGAFDA